MKAVRGFSLIEVLLATTLLASGLALAFMTLRNTVSVTGRAEAMAGDSERQRAVQAFLRRQIGQALPLPLEFDPEAGGATYFDGSAEAIRFAAAMPGYLSRGGPYEQQFRLVRGPAGLRLEFEHRLMTPDGQLDPERKPEILLEGIAEGRFETRMLDEFGKPGPWQETFDRDSQLPMLVRLRLRMQDGRRPWPTLVVAPRLSAASGFGARPNDVPGRLPPAGEEQ